MNDADLCQHWVHAHEEDTADTKVFRPASFPLPPSRGRSSFELKLDGSLVESGPGPTDRTVSTGGGTWKMEPDAKLAFYAPQQPDAKRVLQVRSLSADRLVVDSPS